MGSKDLFDLGEAGLDAMDPEFMVLYSLARGKFWLL